MRAAEETGTVVDSGRIAELEESLRIAQEDGMADDQRIAELEEALRLAQETDSADPVAQDGAMEALQEAARVAEEARLAAEEAAAAAEEEVIRLAGQLASLTNDDGSDVVIDV